MLSPSQVGKYWRAWAAALKALRKLQHTGTDQELRYWVTRQALGREKSMKGFTNPDFDRFLRVCAGYSRMSDLKLQLRLEEMGKIRALMIAEPWLDEIGVDKPGREAYVRAIYARVQAKRPEKGEPVLTLEEIPDADISLIVSALDHTAKHKHGVDHEHRPRYRRERAFPVAPEVEETHETGNRTGDTAPAETEAEKAGDFF